MPIPRRAGNEWLKRKYLKLNRLYFGSRLPRNLRVTWKPDKDLAGCFHFWPQVSPGIFQVVGLRRLEAFLDQLRDPPSITLDPVNVAKQGDKGVEITLLHEMIHAYVYMIEGDPETHGDRFRVWKRRLFDMGALDDLW